MQFFCFFFRDSRRKKRKYWGVQLEIVGIHKSCEEMNDRGPSSGVQSGNIQGSCSDGNHAGENDGNNDEDHGNGDDGDEGGDSKRMEKQRRFVCQSLQFESLVTASQSKPPIRNSLYRNQIHSNMTCPDPFLAGLW